MQIFISLLGIIAGILYIKYNDPITRAVGPIGWAERNLGSGGSYSLHKIIAVLVIVISILSMTGTFQLFLSSTLGKLFPGSIK